MKSRNLRQVCLLSLLLSVPAMAEDTRQLATLPPPAQETLRQEMLANLVALPVIYFYARSWLNNFTFHIRIDWTMFILPTVLLLIVSFVATSTQTIKTAFVNPSRTLKYE